MLGTNLGIDLGTTSVVMYLEGKGIVLDEPNVIAYDSDNRIKAVGKKAYEMLGKNPGNIRLVKPMVNGVVSDFTATRHILLTFLSRVCKNMIFKPNVIICVPSTVTELEKRTILDLTTAAGAAKACLIEEPLAAALGAGLKPDVPKGVMVVDIGGGTTDIAVITMGCISISESVKIAGNAFNDAIARQIRRERDIIIGDKTAEDIKKKIGSCTLRDAELGMTVKGKHYITNLPVSFEVTSSEAYLAMRQPLEAVIEGIRQVLEKTPPELSADIFDSGIYLTGGGSMINGFDRMIERKLGVKTKMAPNPLYCVANGTGEAIAHMDILANNGYVFKSRGQIGGLDQNEQD